MEKLSRLTPATADVLTVLLAGEEALWGLAIIKSSGRPAGSVYPILERLERAGWVTSVWEDDPHRVGPRRRYYELTDEGTTAAQDAVRTVSQRTAQRRSAPAAVTA